VAGGATTSTATAGRPSSSSRGNTTNKKHVATSLTSTASAARFFSLLYLETLRNCHSESNCHLPVELEKKRTENGARQPFCPTIGQPE